MKRLVAYLIITSWVVALQAQFITEVLEYRPAPGQFINAAPFGSPASATSIIGGVEGSLSLGAFGGYVIFRFDGPVENDPENPFGIDFTLFGNPSGTWSEPGVVWVMNDQNGNGVPDDMWYELAGSDHYFSTSDHAYRVTYSNPGSSQAMDVPWTDNRGRNGVIRANSTHPQPYYPLTDSFPAVSGESYTLTGTMIKGAVVVDHPPLIQSFRRAFGYADNQARGKAPFTVPDNPYTPEVEHSGGDAFDISWAVDSAGNRVTLDQADFIMVQTGILHEGGWLGEISTELSGGVDVPPNKGMEGETESIVIRDLPVETDTTDIQLEVIVFNLGIPVDDQTVSWSASEGWASVDDRNVLSVTGSGPLTVTAFLDTDPAIRASVTTNIVPGISLGNSEPVRHTEPGLYPNPADEYVRLTGLPHAAVTIYDLSGKILLHTNGYKEGDPIPLTGFVSGIYLVGMKYGSYEERLKLIKK